MTIQQQQRSDVGRYFEGGDFDKKEARKWLQALGVGDIKGTALDELFSDDRQYVSNGTYKNATHFFRNVHDLIAPEVSNGDIDILSAEEIKSVFDKSENQQPEKKVSTEPEVLHSGSSNKKQNPPSQNNHPRSIGTPPEPHSSAIQTIHIERGLEIEIEENGQKTTKNINNVDLTGPIISTRDQEGQAEKARTEWQTFTTDDGHVIATRQYDFRKKEALAWKAEEVETPVEIPLDGATHGVIRYSSGGKADEAKPTFKKFGITEKDGEYYIGNLKISKPSIHGAHDSATAHFKILGNKETVKGYKPPKQETGLTLFKVPEGVDMIAEEGAYTDPRVVKTSPIVGKQILEGDNYQQYIKPNKNHDLLMVHEDQGTLMRRLKYYLEKIGNEEASALLLAYLGGDGGSESKIDNVTAFIDPKIWQELIDNDPDILKKIRGNGSYVYFSFE